MGYGNSWVEAAKSNKTIFDYYFISWNEMTSSERLAWTIPIAVATAASAGLALKMVSAGGAVAALAKGAGLGTAAILPSCSDTVTLPPIGSTDTTYYHDALGDTIFPFDSPGDTQRSDTSAMEEVPEDVVADDVVDTYIPDPIDSDPMGDTSTVDTFTPAAPRYECLVVAENIYGMKFGVSLVPISDGIVKFSPHPATADYLIDKRLTQPASNWGHDEGDIPDFAKAAIAVFSLRYNDAKELLSIENVGSDGQLSGIALFPMTWLDPETQEPEPIIESLLNEECVAINQPFRALTSCLNPECTTFEGIINFTNGKSIDGSSVLPSTISLITATCKQVN